eukprot:s5110_g3.t2
MMILDERGKLDEHADSGQKGRATELRSLHLQAQGAKVAVAAAGCRAMAPRRRMVAIALLGTGSCWVISQSSSCSRWNSQGGVPSLPSQKLQGPTMTHFASLAVVGSALRQAFFHRPCTSASAASRGRVARSASFKLLGPEGPTVLLSSALIGLSTGFAVVLFEGFITSLEELREELPIPVLAPILGALALAALVAAFGGKDGLAGTDIKSLKSYATAGGPEPPSNWPLRAGANALSAAITLGSGNSLGPEAPAATLGANVAFGLGYPCLLLTCGFAETAGERKAYGMASDRLVFGQPLGAEGAFLEKVSRELRVDDHHPPPCREEYTCDADRVNARSKSRIAVYTYNIGGYEEMRGDYIPCVPSHLDAFLFIDEVGQKRFGSTALKKWQERGWRVVNFTQVEGTKYVSSARLTTKSLKFAPPGWLLNGTWHWLVEYDGNIVVDLHRLGPFLRRRREQALVLLNWSYHQDCPDDSFNCFMTEVTSMLTERVQYVARSRENVLKWKELLEQMHQGRLTHGGRKYTPPNYYEMNVIFRNLKHGKAHKVRDAFEKTFLKCHEIQRDQFVVPFFLWQDGLDEVTEAAPIETLVDELGYCMVSTRVFSIFGAQAAAEETAETGTLTSEEDRELIEKALEGSKVVASLPGKELDRLLKYFQKVTIQEGDTLMKHGDEVSDDEPGLFVTKSGLLDVYVPDGEGEKKVFTYETSGAVVGELAVLFRAPRAATVKARTDAVLWSVDRKSFEACGGRSEGSMARMNQNPDALLASGAAAGVAAGFNAPIAGIFFASEVVRPADDNQLDLTTRLLAAAVSAAVVQSFLPGGPAIKTNDFAWEGGNSELLFFLLLGVLTGIMAYSYKKIAGVARDVASFLKEQGWPAILLPVAGALLTVALSVAVNSRVQFDGFGAVNEVLKDASQPLSLSNINLEPLLQERGSTGLFGAATLLVLMAAKVVATTFSSATGLVGGTFAPSIYVGACLGGALGRLMEGSVMAHSAATTYIVVGMASMLAANCSVPITSVVLAVELAGGASYEATLPLITGIGVALYVSAVLLPALLDGLDRNAALSRLSDAAEDTGM